MAIVDVAILLMVVLGLAYFCVPVWVWSVTLLVVLTLFSKYSHFGVFTLFLCWLLFVASAVFANLKGLPTSHLLLR